MLWEPLKSERHPEDLDSALRIALQLEVSTKDSTRLHQPEMNRSEPKKTREVTKPKTPSPLEKKNEELQRGKRSPNWKPERRRPPSLLPVTPAVQDQGNSSVISAEEWDILHEIVRRNWREMPHDPTGPPHGEINQRMFALSGESKQGPVST